MNAIIAVCGGIVIVLATLFFIGCFLYVVWLVYNKIFHEDYGYWHDRFQKEYEMRSEQLKRSLKAEFDAKLQEETAKILTEFYEKDKRKDNKNDI